MSDTKGSQSEISSRAEQRRCQVLDAAAECFRLHGFHGASMAQISKLAGMSPGHIYHYFENKEAIIAAIVERDAHIMLEWTEFFLSTDSILETMVDEVPAGIEHMMYPHSAGLMLEFTAESARNPTIAAIMQEYKRQGKARMTRILELEMAQRGATTTEDVAMKTEVIGSMFDGLLLKAIYNPNVDKQKLGQLMGKVIRYILTL